MNIFVGNVDYRVTENQLAELFEGFGEVTSVKIPKDRMNGRSKGYAFTNLNGYALNSRNINVSVARPPEERKPRNDNFGGPRNRERFDRNF
jgi:RNA recognition motif-containing protein